MDCLTNPYSDCRIHLDDGKTNVKRVLTGIDIGDENFTRQPIK